MSAYPKMFLPSQRGISHFDLQVNEIGEAVFSCLDQNGRVTSFAAGWITEILGPAVQELCRCTAGKPDCIPMGFHFFNLSPWRFFCERWREVPSVLAAPKPSTKRAIARAIWGFAGHAFALYLAPSGHRYQPDLTDLARADDQENDEREKEMEERRKVREKEMEERRKVRQKAKSQAEEATTTEVLTDEQ